MLEIVLILVLIGAGLYLLNSGIPPVDAKIRTMINVLVVVCTLWWLLQCFGFVSGPFPAVKVN